MGPLFIVLPHPLCTDLPHLFERLEDIRVQHFGAIGAIESLDKRILIRLSGLDIPQRDPAFGTPGHKALRDEFRAIIQPNGLRASPPRHDLLQHPDHTLSRQRGIHFDRQGFADAFIQLTLAPFRDGS